LRGERNLDACSLVGRLINFSAELEPEAFLRIIKVVTDDGNAYYEIVSRLKETNLRYQSVSPGQAIDPALDLVVTSRKELPRIGGAAVAVEDLDEDPLVMEGQLLSRLLEESLRVVLIGIDPGESIGVAVFYGGKEIGARTTNSPEKVVDMVVRFAEKAPFSSLVVKIGDGEPRLSAKLARVIRARLPPAASVEVVDESGTTSGKRKATGVARDQRAAARIAFRKGMRVL
jgi:predicted RNase H-like nuclease (RuvC/YqgF family)